MEGAFIFIRDGVVNELPTPPPPLSKVSGTKLQLGESLLVRSGIAGGRMRALLFNAMHFFSWVDRWDKISLKKVDKIWLQN